VHCSSWSCGSKIQRGRSLQSRKIPVLTLVWGSEQDSGIDSWKPVYVDTNWRTDTKQRRTKGKAPGRCCPRPPPRPGRRRRALGSLFRLELPAVTMVVACSKDRFANLRRGDFRPFLWTGSPSRKELGRTCFLYFTPRILVTKRGGGRGG
jgi:hypothetical protein